MDELFSVFGEIEALEVQVEYLSKLPVWLRIAPAAKGIGVQEDAVTLDGNNHGYAYLGIVLVKLLVAAPVVQLPVLLLAKAVEGLVLSTIKAHAGAPGVLALHGNGLELRTAVCGKEIAFTVIEAYAAVGLVDIDGNGAGGKVNLAHGV